MPLPELPIEVDDPSYDTQRDGVRDIEFTQSHRGKGRDKLVHVNDYPEGPIRYKEH